MTDKQIIIEENDKLIINNVRVNECLLYHKGICLKNGKTCNAKCEYAAYYLEKTLIETNEKFNELKKWLPIVTRLEKQFGGYEKAKGIAYKTYTEQFFRELENLKIKLKMYECQEKYPGQCRCAFRCLDNNFCNDAEKRINTYKTKLEKIKTLLEDALDPDKTNLNESFRNFYKAVELCEVTN